jgi:pilus assembly protein CpaF
MKAPLLHIYQNVEDRIQKSSQWNSPSQEHLDALPTEDSLKALLKEECSQHPDLLSRLSNEFFAAGPIEPLLNNENLNEIMINSHDSIWIEIGGQTSRLPEGFLSPRSWKNFVDRLLEETKQSFDLRHPFVDGLWKGFRLHLAFPPATENGPRLSLRRHRLKQWVLADLLECEWASDITINTLQRLVLQRKNIMIVGATSSGKTSSLNALISCLPQDERLIAIEDSAEIQLPNSLSLRLLTRKPGEHLPEVTACELLKQSLRMNPSRILMGEVRGEEAKDLLLTLSTGHQGSLWTLHANDPREALWRLEMLVQMGAPQWCLQTIRRLIMSSVDYVIEVEKTAQGLRRMKGLHQLVSLEESGFILEPHL